MRTGSLTILTEDRTPHHLEMFLFSWVNSAYDHHWIIEIAARNNTGDQVLLHITTTGEVENRAALSAFYDKLLAALASSLEIQITAYTTESTLSPDEVRVDLKRDLVYLIVS
jgi:hypothetical protein